LAIKTKISITVLVLVIFCRLTACAQDSQDLEHILSEMTLDEKIGQLFMPGIEGQQMDDEMRDLIQENHLGGVILFGGRNVVNRAQTARLTEQMQEAAMATGQGIPLLISIDQEGGVGSHINILTGGVDTVGNLALGASPYIRDTYESYRIMAEDLRAYGINMALAPVLDILLNKDNPMNHLRSFGADVQRVTARAVAATRGYQDHGIIANLKHFPGKGETDVDSHKAAPVNHVDTELILEPFRAAIETGADSVMIGHEYYPSIDPDNVSTVSRKIITGILKEELGFEGLVLTDSITMGGVGLDSAEASMLSLRAGADMVLFAGPGPSEYRDAIDRVKRAVEEGELTTERVDDAISRILAVKIKYGLFRQPWHTPAGEYRDNKKENLSTSRRIASHTVSVLKNENGIVPLDPDDAAGVLVVSPGPFFTVPMMDAPFPVGTTLGNKIKAVAPEVSVMEYDRITLKQDLERALELAAGADLVVIGTILAYFSDELSDFVKGVAEAGRPTVVVGLSVPYDLEKFPQVDAFIAAYNPRSVSLEAAARVLFGEIEPRGILPVDVEMP